MYYKASFYGIAYIRIMDIIGANINDDTMDK